MQVKVRNKILLSLCIALMLMLCAFAVFLTPSSVVKADSIFNENGFEMKTTAGIRVDEEFGGMRFTAKIGTAIYDKEKTYGMLIFPYDYLGLYITENDNYIEEFKSKGIQIINLQDMTPVAVDENGDETTDYYVLKGVISNILYGNLNREFIAIAYYVDGETTVYASVDKENNNYSVVDIAEQLLADEDYVAGLTENLEESFLEFQQIYSYVIKGKNLERGVKESEIVVMQEENLADIQKYYYGEEKTLDGEGKTNVLASFDRDYYYVGLMLPNTTDSTYKEYSKDTSKKTVIVDEKTISEDTYVSCGSGVLKLDYSLGGTAISLPRKIVVANDTVINFKVFSHGWNDFTVSGENQTTTRSQKTNVEVKDKWVTKSILATDLGYEVGDTISELEVYISSYVAGVSQPGYFCIDEITYSTLNYDLDTQNGEVASYNTSDYTALTITEPFDIIEDQTKSVLAINIGGFCNADLPLGKKITVTDNSNVLITYKSNFNLAIKKEPKQPQFGASSSYKTIELNLVDDLGYEVDDEVSCIMYRNHSGTPGFLYIDSIVCLEKDKHALSDALTGYQVANFDDAGYAKLVTGGTVANGEWTAKTGSWTWTGVNLVKQKVGDNYAYNVVPDTATGREGYVVIRISLYKPDSQNCRFYISKTNGSGYEFTSSSEGNWTYSITNTTSKYYNIILPVSKLGYSAGDDFDKLYFAPWNNSSINYEYKVDYIEYVELSTGIANKADALSAYYNILLVDDLGENEVANYNDAMYTVNLRTAGVSSGTDANYQWHGANNVEKSIEKVDGENVAVIKSTSGYYACAGFMFVKNVVVTKDTIFEIRIKSGSGELRVSKFGANSIGVELKGAVKDTWATVNVFATDIGYNVGDTVKGLDLYFGSTCGTYNYIDYIATKEVVFTTTDNKVVDFADENSPLLINGGSVSGEAFTYTGSYGSGATIKFVESKTVKAGDFVVINMKAGGRASSFNGGNMFYLLEGTPTYANWGYPISEFTDYNTMIIPAEKFTAIGNTLSSISVTNWENSSSLSIKWIKYISLGDGLSDNQVVNFTDNNSSYFNYFVGTAGLTYDGSISTDYTNYEWHQRTTAFAYAEVAGKDSAKFTCGNSYLGGSIRFIKGYNEVTANTVIKLNVCTTESTLRLGKYKQDKSIGTGVSNKVVPNQWISIYVKAKDIGYAVGDKLVGFNFFATSGSNKYVAFSDIEVFEFVDKLELSGNQIMNFEDINNMNYTNNGAYISSEKALIHAGLYEAGAVTINFKESHTVSTDDVIAINIYAPTQVRILTKTNSPLCVVSSGSSAWEYTTKSEYQTIILPLTKLGYSVGDEFSSIKVTNWASGSFRIKWIEYIDNFGVVETKQQALNLYNNVDLLSSLNSTNSLANFDTAGAYANCYGLPGCTSDPYSYWSKQSSTTKEILDSYSGATGVFKFHGENYGGAKLTFIRYAVATDSNYLKLRLNTTKQNFYIAKVGSTTNGTSTYVSATNVWTDLYVKITDLGYTVGEIVTGIEFYFDGSNNLFIDDVKLVDNIASGIVVADFSNANGNPFDKPTIVWPSDDHPDKANCQNYNYYSPNTVKEVLTGGVEGSNGGVLHSTNGNICGGYKLSLSEFKVTENLYISIRIKVTQGVVRIYGIIDTENVGTSQSCTANEWVTLEFKATDLGLSVGDKIKGLNVYISGANTEAWLDEITFYTK